MNIKLLSKTLRIIIIAFFSIAALVTLITLIAFIFPQSLAETSLGIPFSFKSHIEGQLNLADQAINVVVSGGTAEVSIDLSHKSILLGTWLFIMSALGVGIWIIRQVKLIFDSATLGKPFATESILRIKKIALAVLACGVAQLILSIFIYAIAQGQLQIPGMQPVLHIDFLIGTIVSSAVIYGIAEIFRYGLSLQEEQDLTV